MIRIDKNGKATKITKEEIIRTLKWLQEQQKKSILNPKPEKLFIYVPSSFCKGVKL